MKPKCFAFVFGYKLSRYLTWKVKQAWLFFISIIISQFLLLILTNKNLFGNTEYKVAHPIKTGSG